MPMMPKSPDKTAVGRLAMRQVGDDWQAYYAMPDTMDGAIPLASIRMSLVDGRPQLKQAFLAVMRDATTAIIENITGQRPTLQRMKPAKEVAEEYFTLGDGPIDAPHRAIMTVIAEALDKSLNGEDPELGRETGFLLMVYPLGDTPGRANFIANDASKRDVVILLKEMIARFEGQPEMKGHA